MFRGAVDPDGAVDIDRLQFEDEEKRLSVPSSRASSTAGWENLHAARRGEPTIIPANRDTFTTPRDVVAEEEKIRSANSSFVLPHVSRASSVSSAAPSPTALMREIRGPVPPRFQHTSAGAVPEHWLNPGQEPRTPPPKPRDNNAPATIVLRTPTPERPSQKTPDRPPRVSAAMVDSVLRIPTVPAQKKRDANGARMDSSATVIDLQRAPMDSSATVRDLQRNGTKRPVPMSMATSLVAHLAEPPPLPPPQAATAHAVVLWAPAPVPGPSAVVAMADDPEEPSKPTAGKEISPLQWLITQPAAESAPPERSVFGIEPPKQEVVVTTTKTETSVFELPAGDTVVLLAPERSKSASLPSRQPPPVRGTIEYERRSVQEVTEDLIWSLQAQRISGGAFVFWIQQPFSSSPVGGQRELQKKYELLRPPINGTPCTDHDSEFSRRIKSVGEQVRMQFPTLQVRERRHTHVGTMYMVVAEGADWDQATSAFRAALLKNMRTKPFYGNCEWNCLYSGGAVLAGYEGAVGARPHVVNEEIRFLVREYRVFEPSEDEIPFVGDPDEAEEKWKEEQAARRRAKAAAEKADVPSVAAAAAAAAVAAVQATAKEAPQPLRAYPNWKRRQDEERARLAAERKSP